MRKYHLFPLLIAVVVMSISCRKETSKEGAGGGTPIDTTGNSGGDTSGIEIGNWKFVSFHVTILQTNEYTQDTNEIKTITTTEYTTENNSGTISFNGSTMTTNAV